MRKQIMIGRINAKELAYTCGVLVTKIVRLLKNYHSNWNFISHEIADDNDG